MVPAPPEALESASGASVAISGANKPINSRTSDTTGAQRTSEVPALPKLPTPPLYLTVLIIATSGLVYELIAGTLASYVLGDSVLQFSTTIGAYLFAMGIGSFLSKFIKRDIAQHFLEVELGAAVTGGLSAPLLFLGFAYADFFSVLLYATIGVIGILVGLEIPLLMRILREHLAFEELVARVLTFDYIGALVGSVAFAIVFVPTLGLNRTALLFGMLNAVVAFGGTFVLAPLLERSDRFRLRGISLAVLIGLGACFYYAEELTRFTEAEFYSEPILYSEQTPYQRVVLTGDQDQVQLFLNGNLQFASVDEHRYHEALVHPAMFLAMERGDAARVLVLGGGDGLALRELWKYDSVESVTLVDLDEAVTRMARQLPPMRQLTENAFEDPRLELIHDDAMVWLDEEAPGPFDVIIIDFPDPNNFSLGKLYSRRFYRLVQRALARDGVLAVQSTAPLYARRSFWCIERTIRESGFTTHPYHAAVPSFGEWGFVLATPTPSSAPMNIRLPRDQLRFLDDESLRAMFHFPPDMSQVEVEVNQLNEQHLVHYYLDEWGRFSL